MSTRFTVICDTCEEVGPHIRRHHIGAFLQAEHAARFFPEWDPEQADADWGAFLIEHEYHELRLATEWRPPKPPEEPRKFTHELLADGTLRELP